MGEKKQTVVATLQLTDVAVDKNKKSQPNAIK